MAMLRSLAATRLTTRSPMEISPVLMSSSPAIMRSSVDLPQPDGPTSTTSSLSAISTSMPWITSVVPKDFRTLLMPTLAIPRPYVRLSAGCAPARAPLAMAPRPLATASSRVTRSGASGSGGSGARSRRATSSVAT